MVGAGNGTCANITLCANETVETSDDVGGDLVADVETWCSINRAVLARDKGKPITAAASLSTVSHFYACMEARQRSPGEGVSAFEDLLARLDDGTRSYAVAAQGRADTLIMAQRVSDAPTVEVARGREATPAAVLEAARSADVLHLA